MVEEFELNDEEGERQVGVEEAVAAFSRMHWGDRRYRENRRRQ